jgi:hypothetical protein
MIWPVPDDPDTAVCPPHHWEVGTANSVETWVCRRCHEQKTVDRKALQAVTAPFTRGGPRPKPDSMPPAPTDLPAELTG